jgi:hypothetical protein
LQVIQQNCDKPGSLIVCNILKIDTSFRESYIQKLGKKWKICEDVGLISEGVWQRCKMILESHKSELIQARPGLKKDTLSKVPRWY